MSLKRKREDIVATTSTTSDLPLIGLERPEKKRKLLLGFAALYGGIGFSNLPPEIKSLVFDRVQETQNKVKLLSVNKFWSSHLKATTRTIVANSSLKNIVMTFSRITTLSLTYMPEDYKSLKSLKQLKSFSWGGEEGNIFGQCPRDLLKVLPEIQSLREVHIHHKTGSCSICSERYGWLTQLTSLSICNTTGLQESIKQSISKLKNLEHLRILDVEFENLYDSDPTTSWEVFKSLGGNLKSLVLNRDSLDSVERSRLKEIFRERLITLPIDEEEESETGDQIVTDSLDESISETD